MTQNEKDLLLKDLCARLPYEVKFNFNGNVYTLSGIDECVDDIWNWVKCLCSKRISPIDIKYCKPYLFPLSSMTKEQKNQLKEIWDTDMNKALDYTISGEEELSDLHQFFAAKKVIDWFNKNHFDFNGLIEKGLAIDATGLNIY